MKKNSSYYRHAAASKCAKVSGTLALIYFVHTLIMGVISSLSKIGENGTAALGGTEVALSFFGAIAMLLITGPFFYSMSGIAAKVDKEEKVELGNLFDGFKSFQTSFLLFILQDIFIALWTLLCIIPGFIKLLSYSMSYYISLDNPEKSALECITASKELMKGHKWQFFCLMFSYIGWIILCMITLGILNFWVNPKMEQAKYQFYKEISGQNA